MLHNKIKTILFIAFQFSKNLVEQFLMLVLFVRKDSYLVFEFYKLQLMLYFIK